MPKADNSLHGPIRILHLEDDPRDAELIRRKLEAEGLACDIMWVNARSAFETALEQQPFDLVFADYNLPDYDGISALQQVSEKQPEVPVIVISGTLGEEEAVECLKTGATDYVLKQRLQRLGAAVMRALREAEQRQKRRETEAALRDSEERFRATFEQAAVGMALRDIDPRRPHWLRVNQKLCDILGYTKEELLQLTSVDITPPEERGLAVDYNNKMLRGEIASYSREKRYMRKDGSLIWVNLSVTAVRGPDGSPTHVISVIQDITDMKRAAEEVSRQRAFLRQVIDLDRNFIFAKDRQGRFVLVNQAVAEAYGTSVEDLTGKTDADFNPDPEEVAHFRRDDLEVMDRLQEKFIPEEKITDASGRVRWLQTVKRAIPGPDGKAHMVLGVAADITQRKQQEARISRLSRIHALLSGINALIVRVPDRRQLLDEACEIAVRAGGFRMAWIGFVDPQTLDVVPAAKAGHEEGYLDIIRPSVNPDVPGGQGITGRAMRDRQAVVMENFTRDLKVVSPAEAHRRGYRAAIALPLVAEEQVIGAMNFYAGEPGVFDAEEIRLLSELAGDVAFALEYLDKKNRLNHLAYYDGLTGLPNRALFSDRVAQRVSAARHDRKIFFLMIIDLERFRSINESFGRQAGDDLLRQVAQRLQNALDETAILARMGIDHFAIATQRVDAAGDAAHLIEQILAIPFRQPFRVGDNELRIAVRAGIVVYPADGTDAEGLLNNAEAALKQAKAARERYLFYQPRMNAAVAQTLLLENKLRQALEKEQFVLHYQPRMNLAKGLISGLEALIRWNDPEGGLVPPAQFIPLLEESGLILEAGRWAMRKALADYREWCDRGLRPPRIAVNVSPIQLRQGDFVQVVRAVLGEFPAGAHGLDFEITESLIMEDIEGSIEKLRAVREMGIHTAIDDFGTGYSSLAYLARLPVGSLKIDRAFIIDMMNNPDHMTIVSTIISLAHSLGLTVTAEGVETQQQLNLLKLLKCDEMQGYLFSRPVPAEQIERLLREQKTLPG